MADLFLTPKASAAGLPFPATFKLLVDGMAQHLGVGGLAGFSGINAGYDVPVANDRDKPWFRTDVDGNPVGWYWYNGTKWDSAEPLGKIVMFDKAVTPLPPHGWKACDGVGTYIDNAGASKAIPDLRDRFVRGAGNLYALNDVAVGTGTCVVTLPDSSGHILQPEEMPFHGHWDDWSVGGDPADFPTHVKIRTNYNTALGTNDNAVSGGWGVGQNQLHKTGGTGGVTQAHVHPSAGTANGTVSATPNNMALNFIIYVGINS